MHLWEGRGGVGWGSGYTVHVYNQPMIVLLVPFRKGGVCIRGSVKLGERGTHRFSSYPFLLFSLFGHPHTALFSPVGSEFSLSSFSLTFFAAH